MLTCVELLKRDLYCISVVKNCTKGFLIAFVAKYENTKPSKGERKVITTNVIVTNPTNTRTVIAIFHCVKEG